jgi:hypothetical protein
MQALSSGGAGGYFDIRILDPSGAYKKGMDPRITRKEIEEMPIKYKLLDQHNMMFRRGLAYILYQMFSYNEGYSGLSAPWTIPDVSPNPTTNPFQYMVASDSLSRPNWTDSDGADCIHKGTAIRGVGMVDGSNTDWKYLSYNQYSSPYKDLEWVSYVYPTSGTNTPRGLDGFQINSLGIANSNILASATYWGIRSVLGRPPRYQGVTDQTQIGEAATDGGSDPLPINTGALVNSYLVSSEQPGYEGHNAFDGAVADYGLNGAVTLGGSWYSNDVAGPHMIARIWTNNHKIEGARIVIPAGINFNYVPNYFKFQYLTGMDPTQEVSWTDIPGADYSASAQANNIYGTEEFGYNYSWTAVTTKGIRLKNISAYASSGGVRIAELMFWEKIDPSGSGISLVSGVNDTLRLAVEFPSGVPTYRVFTLGNVGPTKDMNVICAALNAQIYGYEMEAVRGPFGHLWLQATPNGADSYFQADTVANGSTANTNLGLGSTPTQKQGVNVPVTKAQGDAMTITYRHSLDARV